MSENSRGHELYHEIFGSVLDRLDLSPYLLRDCAGYREALSRASRMLANRGFSMTSDELDPGELERASRYVSAALDYALSSLIPPVRSQFCRLASLKTSLEGRYRAAEESLASMTSLLSSGEFRDLVDEDPRHLFLLASSAKYPLLFEGKPGFSTRVPPRWRFAACTVLKLAHLVKSLEEDSQDIYDYARLGVYFESTGIPLSGLFGFSWDDPANEPDDEHARLAYMKLAAFFGRLGLFVERPGDVAPGDVVTGDGVAPSAGRVSRRARARPLVFNSGDGISVEIQEIKARLKSPGSMIAKICKDAAEEAYAIRDVLAVTFLLSRREDCLILFHALQKQGVILQENIASSSITQTLFDSPQDMESSVRELMRALAAREGSGSPVDEDSVRRNAEDFFAAINSNSRGNPQSSGLHRKFQCKLNFSVPVFHDPVSGRVVSKAFLPPYRVRQHTVPVELRISDAESWERSEMRGEAHHAAYKFRQSIMLLNRVAAPLFFFSEEDLPSLRRDQGILFL